MSYAPNITREELLIEHVNLQSITVGTFFFGTLNPSRVPGCLCEPHDLPPGIHATWFFSYVALFFRNKTFRRPSILAFHTTVFIASAIHVGADMAYNQQLFIDYMYALHFPSQC